jgi:DNA-binding CsgD family transcriptional regulator
MSLDEGLSQFIGRLYEAVYDADSWRRVVHEIMSRTESRIAFISSVDLRNREFSRFHFYGPDKSSVADGNRDYGDEFYRIDPSLSWASERPDAGMCDTAFLMPEDEYLSHPYVTWNKSVFGTTHWRVFYTKPVDGLSLALSLHPSAEIGAAPQGYKALHKLVFNHLERALRLAARPPELSTTTDPVFILDNEGRVISMSPRAEQLLHQNDGLSIERRCLKARLGETTRRLDEAMKAAVTAASVGGAGGAVRIPRNSGRSDWLALFSPCPRFLDHLPVGRPAAILRIVEPQSAGDLSFEVARLFDLTGREFEVADALLHGHSLESLCQLLGISRNTAKVHLQALFRKTRTNRQAELIHLLAEVARG